MLWLLFAVAGFIIGLKLAWLLYRLLNWLLSRS